MKISVIIPVYNSEKYLYRCLQSLKQQDNFNDLEVIIINDGSTDNSLKIISKFKKENKNVIVKTIKNSGVSKARNEGINLASSKYISFLDSDDYIEPGYYTSVLNFLNNKEDYLIVFGYTVKYENSNIKIKKSINNSKILMREEIIDCFLSSNEIGPNVWNKLFLTKIAKEIKFDENIKIAEDKWFVFQYLTKIERVIILPIINYNYILNENSTFLKPFNKNKFDSLIISDRIKKYIYKYYPILKEKVCSYDIDVKCRIYSELSLFSNKKIYINEYKKLGKEIRNYSIKEKIKYSNFKHSLGFILIKISPKLYLFFSKKLKFQYKI